MKIYLDSNITQIKVFRDLVQLLNGLIESDIDALNTINKLEDIYTMSKIDDPVKDFLQYYVDESRLNKTQDWIDYASNTLYNSKGYTKVIDNLGELLGIEVDYTYNFPVLELISFSNLTVSNLNTYVSRLENMLNYLLFFTQLKIEIETYIISIRDTLTYYHTNISSSFRITEAKDHNEQ